MSTVFPVPSGGFGGGGGGFPVPGPTSEEDDRHRFGWHDLLPNLWNEIEQTATSLPAMAVNAYQHPLQALFVDPVVGTARVAYNTLPLAQGLLDPRASARERYLSEYKQNFLEDPLGQTLLLGTLGRGAIGRVAAGSAIRGLAEAGAEVRPGVRMTVGPTRAGRPVTLREATRAGVFGLTPKGKRGYIGVALGEDVPGVGVAGTEIASRRLPRSAGRAYQAEIVDSLLKTIVPRSFPLLGESSRAARALRRQERPAYLGLMSLPAYESLQNTWNSMSKKEQVASRIHNLLPNEADLDEYVSYLRSLSTPEADQMANVLTDPKYRALYNDPTDKMRDYNAHGHAVDHARQQILIKTGAITPDEFGNVPEFISSPYRHTRIIRGAKTLTDSLAYKYLRKTDADLRQVEKTKGKLVRDAERFGTSDLREITRLGREASNQMINESSFRAMVHEGRAQVSAPGKGELRERLPSSNDLEDLNRMVDDQYERVNASRDQLDSVMGGEFDTRMLDELNMTPEGGWSTGKAAIAQDLLNGTRREVEGDLSTVEELIGRAQQGRLTTAELDSLDLQIPRDITEPTADDLARAKDLRVQANDMEQALKERRKRKLNDEEVARLKKKINDFRAEASQLSAPSPIHRSPSYLKRRGESRYRQAVKKLVKQRDELRAELENLSKEIPVHKDPSEQLRIAGMTAFERKYRKETQRYERLLVTEHALRQSALRSADAATRATASQAAKSAHHERKINYIAAQRSRMRDLIEHKHELLALRDEIDQSRGQLVGGGDPLLLAAELKRNGRMLPFYLPDEMRDISQPRRFSLAQGSIYPQRPGADIYPSRNILFRRGLIDLGAEGLGPAYFRAAKHSLNVALHAQAMQMATKIPKGASPPKGWEYLRRTTGEVINPVEKLRGSHMKAVAREYEREHDLTTADATDPEIDFDEADGSKYRLIVPKAFANEFRAEGKRSSTFIRYVFEKPMDVWRTLLLHLRVPWLVNNILGNSFLYAIRFAGVGGMASLLHMYAGDARTAGLVPTMRKMLSARLTEDQMRQLYAEQIRGTHFETQATGDVPETLKNLVPEGARDFLDENPAVRAGVRALQEVPRVLPRLDKRYERRLRRLATQRILRGSEEVRDAYKTLRKQGQDPTFHEAVQHALDGNEGFRDYVVQEVNAGLGDFLSLSKVERQWIRQTVPFYAWMREISRISGRLLVDHPMRAIVLMQMAEAASEIQPEDIPSYMRGAILTEKAGILGRLAEALPGGGGTDALTSALALHGASPYATVPDTLRGLGALVPGGNQYQLRDFAGNLNPFFGAIVGGYQRPERGSSRGLFADTLEEFGRSVPQAQVIAPYPSYLQPERTRWDMLARMFGDPRIRYSEEEAAYQRSQGR